jgi:hypothetical protein
LRRGIIILHRLDQRRALPGEFLPEPFQRGPISLLQFRLERGDSGAVNLEVSWKGDATRSYVLLEDLLDVFRDLLLEFHGSSLQSVVDGCSRISPSAPR